jgi:hypothetical protein
VEQYTTAGRDVYDAGRDINQVSGDQHIHNGDMHMYQGERPENSLEFLRSLSALEQAKEFWAIGDVRQRVYVLTSVLGVDDAALLISDRMSDDDGIHAAEVSRLIEGMKVDRAIAILKHPDSDKVAPRILVSMRGKLPKFLMDVNRKSVEDAAHFLYLAARDRGFQEEFGTAFADGRLDDCRLAWMWALPPDRAAYILETAGRDWPDRILRELTADRAAKLLVSENGSGHWLERVPPPGVRRSWLRRPQRTRTSS